MSSPRRLLIRAKLAAYIRTLHPEIKRKVRAALEILLTNPLAGKSLRGRLLGFRSMRVGKFRVIYRESGENVRIVAVGPRTTFYEEAERLARKRSDD